MKRIFRNFRIWLGIKCLKKQYIILNSDLKWYLSEHRIEKLHAGSNIFEQNRFHSTILNLINNLLEFNCVILDVIKTIDPENGDIVVTISYLKQDSFANIINWAANNLSNSAGLDVHKWLESANFQK